MSDFLFVAGREDAEKRLDLFLLERLLENESGSYSRSGVQRLISEGGVRINGGEADKSARVKPGDSVAAVFPDIAAIPILPEYIPIPIVFEDESLLVVNKPKGMVVHPAPGHETGTLVNALLFHCGDSLSGINGVRRPGIVHRIDKDTSGLLVAAKTDFAHRSLAAQFAEHSIERTYHAVLHGRFGEEEGSICRTIGRDAKDRKKFSVLGTHGKPAVTHYRLIENFDRYAYLVLRLETGRTHQIRVHMASVGHPVAGDAVYGPKSTPKELCGQCLHAKTIGFRHPKTNESLRFDSELPGYFTDFLAKQRGKDTA